MATDREIAELLLQTGAVQISIDKPFTWTSGIQSPIYCDNRVVYGHPLARRIIVDALCERIRALPTAPQAIAGTATAAIGWGAMVADRLELPFAYVRPQPKEHGDRRWVEGDLRQGIRVLVIEDLLSTGASAMATVEALHGEVSAIITDVLAIFSYELPVVFRNARRVAVALHPLTTLSILLSRAQAQGILRAKEDAEVREFLKDPEKWGGGARKVLTSTGGIV